MSYLSFKKEWTGRRIDYDHVYYYQCVDEILEYQKEEAHVASGIYGNAIDYWYRPSPAFTKANTRVKPADLKQGDTVVLRPIDSQPVHAAGHIGILDSKTTTAVRLLEQNKNGTGTGLGSNAIGVYRDIPMSRVLGGWRIRVASPTTGTATAIRDAYVRTAPTTSAALGGSKLLHKGDTFKYTAKVKGQLVNQNGVATDVWYRSLLGHYVWSGNCKG